MSAVEHFIIVYLMYFIVPLWLLAGFADWLCHRFTDIEHTSGPTEFILHLVMLAETGIPALLVLFFEVNALVLVTVMAAFGLHELTALWDVSYALRQRRVTPFEQHMHSFLELIPLLTISCLAFLHSHQIEKLLGGFATAADWQLHPKNPALPVAYVYSVLGAIAIFQVIPYLDELRRGLRAKSFPASLQRRHVQRY